MAKASSPIRIQADLMNSATLSGKLQHRSASEQIEYWASLGQKVESLIDMESILRIKAGVLRLKLEPVDVQPVSPSDVFRKLAGKRMRGELAAEVSTAAIRYQASAAYLGFLEQIDSKGNVRVGQFENGEFKLKKLS